MTEAYDNTNPCNPESIFDAINDSSRDRQREETIAQENISNFNNSNSPLNGGFQTDNSTISNATTIESESSSNTSMNWQKVAHKLREYNRKLLKKVFRIEQELSDLDNKFKKQLEKARSSDILVAQQESEIQKYQEQVELFDRQLTSLEQTVNQKEIRINTLGEQYQFSQQQTAKLERQCTLLKENSDRQNYELTIKDQQLQELQIELEKHQQLAIQSQTDRDRQTEELTIKEQQIQELKTKLERQQRLAIQYKAELQRERKTTTTIPPKTTTIPPKPSVLHHQSDRRTIEPWSNPSNAEPKISLPQTKPLPLAAKKIPPSETIKTAAEIATWGASQVKSTPQNKKAKKEAVSKSSAKAQPKSLAAIDLPTFPRQK